MLLRKRSHAATPQQKSVDLWTTRQILRASRTHIDCDCICTLTHARPPPSPVGTLCPGQPPSLYRRAGKCAVFGDRAMQRTPSYEHREGLFCVPPLCLCNMPMAQIAWHGRSNCRAHRQVLNSCEMRGLPNSGRDSLTALLNRLPHRSSEKGATWPRRDAPTHLPFSVLRTACRIPTQPHRTRRTVLWIWYLRSVQTKGMYFVFVRKKERDMKGHEGALRCTNTPPIGEDV